MPSIRIDGVDYQVPDGRNLLETALSLGLDLPYFCWHPAMGSIGACRQCAVVQYMSAEEEAAGRGRIVMGCMTPASDGAIFSLAGERAREFRATVVEALMLDHPHDCPVCGEGGECHLQDMTVMTGHRDRHYRGRKRTHRNQYLGPLLNHEMNRCITCYRCTRFYRDYAGGTDLAALASRDNVYFGRHEDGVLESEFAGNLVEVCPTGVFTDKPLVHDYTRKWDLQSAPSICAGCAVGCNTLPGERYGRLKRVHNRFNAAVNGYFLCDRGRFGARFVNDPARLEYPGLRREDGRYDAVDHHTALQHMAAALRGARIAGIGSPRASVEANFLLRTLVGAEHFCPGSSAAEQALVNLALQLRRDCSAGNPDLGDIESADAVLVLGEDPTHTAPRIALALRQSVRRHGLALAGELGLAPWQDAAVRNLAQDQRSPLFIAACGATRLDDVAAQHVSLSPPDIARLGAWTAAIIRGYSVADPHARAIANALLAAEHPLVVSGTGSGDADVLRAAAEVAQALCDVGRPATLCLTVPEANSLGQALLAGAGAPDIDALDAAIGRGEYDALVVLENDLFRRAPEAQVTRMLAAAPTAIVLDGLDNATASSAALVLPAASFAEAEGTLVSLEGRAQRHYPVFRPAGERRPGWVWLLACLKELERVEAAALHHFDDVTRACADAVAELADIPGVAPDHAWRNRGVRVPRQPQRYSGRTAMRANLSVHEPQQPEDEETPLAFSMEGLNRGEPGALVPFVWAPGWNSNQSVHKFQAEVGGPLRGGSAGVRLLAGGGPGTPEFSPPGAYAPLPGRWLLVPRQRIFGSDELSALSPGVRDLVQPACLALNAADARALGLAPGDGVEIGSGIATLEVAFDDTVPPGCAAYWAGHPGTFNLAPGQLAGLCKARDWQPRGRGIIASDRAGGAA